MHFSGIIVKGHREATKIGFPTINISPKRIPKNASMGVYTAAIKTNRGNFFGAFYYGPRFSDQSIVCEIHIFGLQEKLSGKIFVELKKKLRGVEKFKNIFEAKKTIRNDIMRCRALLKNAIIFHGLDETPNDFWYPWIKKYLEKKGYHVWAPQLPHAQWPTRKDWLSYALKNGFFSDSTVLIGRSASPALIASILEKIPVKIDKAILVAGFLEPMPNAANALLQKRYDFRKIRLRARKIFCIHSDNDPWGFGPEVGRKIAKSLHAKLFILKGQGHFGSKKFHQPYKKFPFLKRFFV